MARGEPLTDADRAPWLARLRALIGETPAAGQSAVLACSALKAAYRQTLADGLPGVRFVYLRVSPEIARARLEHRAGHFMPAALVDSQFAALEEPEDTLTVDAEQPVAVIVNAVIPGIAGVSPAPAA